MNEKQRAERILANLEGVNEDLLAFMDDVGLSINYRDAASREAGNRFLDVYDPKLQSFRELSNDIAAMIRERLGIPVEETPGHRVAVETAPNDPAFANRRPHRLDEDFTFTKPIGFTLHGTSFKGISKFVELYVALCRELARQQPERFRKLPESAIAFTSHHRPMFARNAHDLDQYRLIAEGIYAETQLSNNDKRNMIVKLLAEFGIPTSEMAIYLSQEPGRDEVA